jgi:hypothetical protein
MVGYLWEALLQRHPVVDQQRAAIRGGCRLLCKALVDDSPLVVAVVVEGQGIGPWLGGVQCLMCTISSALSA